MSQGINGSRVLSYLQPSKMVVYENDAGEFVSLNTENGSEIDYATGALALQAAMDALTASRTWKERVHVKGSIPVNSTCTVPDYITLTVEEIRPTVETDPVLQIAGTHTSDWKPNIDVIGKFAMPSGIGAASQLIDIDGAWNVYLDLIADRFRDTVKIDNSELISIRGRITNAREKGVYITSSDYTTHTVSLRDIHLHGATDNVKLFQAEAQGGLHPALTALTIENVKLYAQMKPGSRGLSFDGAGTVGAKGVSIRGGHAEAVDYPIYVDHPVKRMTLDDYSIGRGGIATQITKGIYVNDAGARISANNLQFYGCTLAIDANAGRVYVGDNIQWDSLVTTRYAGNVFGGKYQRWIQTPFEKGTATVTITIADAYMIPVFVEQLTPFSELQLCVEGTGGNFRMGVYEDNGDTPVGGALVVESGSIASTVLFKRNQFAVTKTWLERGLYWVALICDAAAVLRRSGSAIGASAGPLTRYHYSRGGGYGAFTDPCPACATSGQAPFMQIVTDIPTGL